jgi:hypothetical protein
MPTPPPLDDTGRPTPPPGGLQKRVRGAQMPSTEPLNLRRSGNQRPVDRDPAAAGDPQAPRPQVPQAEAPEPNGDHRGAEEVYGFLSNFSAGVQRGLDESRGRNKNER